MELARDFFPDPVPEQELSPPERQAFARKSSPGAPIELPIELPEKHHDILTLAGVEPPPALRPSRYQSRIRE